MRRVTLLAAALAFSAHTLAAQRPQRVTSTAFQYQAAKDPISDEDRSSVSVAAPDGSYAPPRLTFQCQGGGVLISVSHIPYTFDEQVNVTWRIDQETPQSGRWQRANTSDAYLTDGWAPFIAGVQRGSTLAVRVTTDAGATATQIYRLTGATAALQRLQCVRELMAFTRDSTAAAAAPATKP
jgi:hypothetical protein